MVCERVYLSQADQSVELIVAMFTPEQSCCVHHNTLFKCKYKHKFLLSKENS